MTFAHGVSVATDWLTETFIHIAYNCLPSGQVQILIAYIELNEAIITAIYDECGVNVCDVLCWCGVVPFGGQDSLIMGTISRRVIFMTCCFGTIICNDSYCMYHLNTAVTSQWT